METQRGLGWLPDVPKPNDYSQEHGEVVPLLSRTTHAASIASAGAAKAGAPAAMPAQVDLRSWFSPIEDQGSLGSCTANAAVGLLEYFERRATGRYVDASRLFVYKTERDLLGWTGDTGAYLRTAMEALVLFGAPPERYWPYDGGPPAANTHYDVEPPAFCYAFGANYQAVKYFRLDPNATPAGQVLANIKRFAGAGFPSMFGFPVFSEYDHPLPGGLVAFPAAGSTYRGGHANVVAGYDDTLMIGKDKGALLIRNSWGPGWANGGYAWMSYRYVTDGLATDWWSMISAKWVDTGQF
jgi:C1A family cysteine protease